LSNLPLLPAGRSLSQGFGGAGEDPVSSEWRSENCVPAQRPP